MAPKSKTEKRDPFKAVLSGGIAGSIEICITYPTEYVKTQLQLYKHLAKLGPIGCARDCIKRDGPFGLYRGLTPVLAFTFPKTAMRFFSYEVFKNVLTADDGILTTRRALLAGLGAGVCEAIFVVTPSETLKVKLIDDQLKGTKKYNGLIHGVTRITKEVGLKGLYQGLLPTVLKQGSNQAIRWAVFEKTLAAIVGKDRDVSQSTMIEDASAGAIAGAASVFGNTPLDVVKTKMQGLEAHKYTGTWDCFKQTYKTDGLIGFYKGVTPRMTRVCMDVGIVMVLYRQIYKIVDKAWVSGPSK